MTKYEIEIKSLLGSRDRADELIDKMKQTDTNFISSGRHKQLNHYFVGGDLKNLKPVLERHMSADKKDQFDHLVENIRDFSVRTRWADGDVIFVIKATVDDTTSSNGTARKEFESKVDMSLEELDELLLENGFEYQAKWSREREEYKYKDLDVTVDKNAGYGYLAEFETVIDDEKQAEDKKKYIRDIMNDLDIEELPQDRLERMFEYYNANWPDYYGTDKIFTIK